MNEMVADTIQSSAVVPKPEIKEGESVIPANFANQTFDFQVNAIICYHSFRHFVKSESKKIFFQAWLKDKESKRISNQTDSLRKVYLNSSNEQKQEISGLILKNEGILMALNQEIPSLYQNARSIEDKHWQSVSVEDVKRFQAKIGLFQDSILQAAGSHKEQLEVVTVTDTYTSPRKTSKAKEIKAEANTGIIYKIQIGAYKGRIPEPATKLIKKLSIIRKVENYVDDKGVKVYTTGNLTVWQDAVTMQTQLKQEGVKNPVVVAFRNGKKITMIEAKKLDSTINLPLK